MANISPPTSEIIFFNAQTSNATSTPVSFIFPSGSADLKFWGTFDGASIQFQTGVPPINGASVGVFVPVSFSPGGTSTFTAPGQVTMSWAVYGEPIRCVLTGAGGSTSINVTAQVVSQ